jgi:hypothetical protein
VDVIGSGAGSGLRLTPAHIRADGSDAANRVSQQALCHKYRREEGMLSEEPAAQREVGLTPDVGMGISFST